MTRRSLFITVVVVFVLVVLAGALYEWITPGLSSARTQPSQIEKSVATFLLHQSVPAEAKARTNPLGSDPAEIAAGRDQFKQKCELCHAYEGSGATQIGAGEYPRPPPLRTNLVSMSDGEIFYHIRNGIRNTGMPAWGMPDREIWQIVTYLRHLPKVASLTPEQSPAAT